MPSLTVNEAFYDLAAGFAAMLAFCVPVRIELHPGEGKAYARDYRFTRPVTAFHFAIPSPQWPSQWQASIRIASSPIWTYAGADGKPSASARFELRLNNSGIQRQ